jgi:aspartyl-tRNA(Asn)/glutamyl-tRNA(Gln) amidotransferase subunit B
MENKYTPVIGLEIHVELATKSKMFCGCPADWFGKEPNTQTCPVCLGLPGALPVANKKAIESCILIGKALGCETNKISKFDRKNYFYPDLSKSYQISQYDLPFSYKGEYEFISQKSGELKKIGITRVHMEEDTGKLSHEDNETLVDFNRSGVPLVEIVTEPDFDNSDDVKQFLEELQVIIRYLGVSDADMEKGSMRLEPNISVRITGTTELPPYKVEVKNINSFRFGKLAIEYEVKRHIELLEKGEIPPQETRGFNDKKNITVSQRRKEEASDYRYFPDPDIPPFEFTDEFIKEIADRIPELPHQKVKRYVDQFEVKNADAYIITRSKTAAYYFDELLQELEKNNSKQLAAKCAAYIVNKKISLDINPKAFIEEVQKLQQPKETDAGRLSEVINEVISQNPELVDQYKAGKTNLMNALLGMVMKEMKGQADPQLIRTELEKAM